MSFGCHKMWGTFYKLRNLLAFYEEFCHMELVGAYKIKEVILQMLGGGRY